MISIVLCSRISGNLNWRLMELLDSIQKNSASCQSVEVLIKFDYDDPPVSEILPNLQRYAFTIKHCIGPRGRGYLDLHLGYNQLFTLLDPRSKVVTAFADDFVIVEPHWDTLILEKCRIYPDTIFFLHGCPHPPSSRLNYLSHPFLLDEDPYPQLEYLPGLDEAPMWGRQLLEILGGFGYVSFTDCWTYLLEHSLQQRYQIHRTVFLRRPIMKRVIHPTVDSDQSSRWWNERTNNFDVIRSPFFRLQIEQQTRNLALNIQSQFHLNQLLTINPHDPDVHRLHAEILIQTGQSEMALEILKENLEYDPTHINSIRLLAQLYKDKDCICERMELYQSGLKNGSKCGPFLADFIQLHLEVGNNDKVDMLAQLVETMSFEDTDVYRDVACTFIQSQRLKDAERWGLKGLALNDKCSELHGLMATLYFTLQHYGLSIKHVRLAITYNENNVHTVINAARILGALGHHEVALTVMREFNRKHHVKELEIILNNFVSSQNGPGATSDSKTQR